jgi:hypothetical protein
MSITRTSVMQDIHRSPNQDNNRNICPDWINMTSASSKYRHGAVQLFHCDTIFACKLAQLSRYHSRQTV